MPKRLLAIPVVIAALLALGGCNLFSKDIDDIIRVLGGESGTWYNYGADGSVTFQAHCNGVDFTRDTEYDRYNADGKLIEQSSVVKVTCGDNQFSTVGFTSVYISDFAKPMLFADPQKFYKLRIDNPDHGIPLINFAWRDVKNIFVGTARVASVCDQNNNPILGFAADGVTGYATSVDKSTMFKLDKKGKKTGYVLVYRGSYNVIDTELLNYVA